MRLHARVVEASVTSSRAIIFDLLRPYFTTDDGSLPDITVSYADSAGVPSAFAHLFTCGGRIVNARTVWMRDSESEKLVAGPADAESVIAGTADSFHVLLTGVVCAGVELPDLGVFVFPNSLDIDYRMGPQWGDEQVHGLIELLRQLRGMGGEVAVTWWGENGARDFSAALGL